MSIYLKRSIIFFGAKESKWNIYLVTLYEPIKAGNLNFSAPGEKLTSVGNTENIYHLHGVLKILTSLEKNNLVLKSNKSTKYLL